jgi:hypothetical protein
MRRARQNVSRGRLCNSLIESFALRLCDLQLKCRRLAHATQDGESPGAPWAAAMDLVQVAELSECCLVTQWHVDHTLYVRQYPY